MELGKKWLVITLAVAVLVSAAAGVAMATATPTAAGNTGQVFLDKLAGILGIDRTKLDDALKIAGGQTVDQMLQDGKITQQQADQMRSRIGQGFPFFGNIIKGHGYKMAEGGFMPLKSLAGALDMTLQDILSALRSGKTIDELAMAKGTTVADIQNTILTNTKDQLDKMVQSDKMTQAREDQVYSNLQQSINSGDWIKQLQKGCQARGKQWLGGKQGAQ